MRVRFQDRESAGIELAERLATLVGCEDLFVLGLPPGGLVVAARVAEPPVTAS